MAVHGLSTVLAHSLKCMSAVVVLGGVIFRASFTPLPGFLTSLVHVANHSVTTAFKIDAVALSASVPAASSVKPRTEAGTGCNFEELLADGTYNAGRRRRIHKMSSGTINPRYFLLRKRSSASTWSLLVSSKSFCDTNSVEISIKLGLRLKAVSALRISGTTLP